jgi:UDP-glucose 4-epimerase
VQDPITSDQVNVGGTLNILDAAKEEGVTRVVFASSSSVYGANEEVPKRETMIPAPISPYAVTKLTGEHYCRVFSHIYGLETVALRYFNVFGPRMDPTSAYSAFVSIFVVGLLNGSPLVVHGDGSISRDFTYITNVVEANMRALDTEGVSGEAFNVGCGDTMSLNEVIDTLREFTGKEGTVSYGPPRSGDVQQSMADISKAREMLAYAPGVAVREGLKRAVLWYGKGK